MMNFDFFTIAVLISLAVNLVVWDDRLFYKQMTKKLPTSSTATSAVITLVMVLYYGLCVWLEVDNLFAGLGSLLASYATYLAYRNRYNPVKVDRYKTLSNILGLVLFIPACMI